MLIAICRTAKNKPGKDEFGKINGMFENLDVSLAELADEVRQGHAFCAQHEKGWRNKHNFTSAGFLAADIDQGMRLEDAIGHEFVQRFGGLLYTSPSHTEEAHRFRIVFELEEPITDRAEMERAYTGLIGKFGADGSCRDACRMFFGNTQAQVTSIGKRLPKSEVDVLAIRGGEMGFSQDTLGVPGGTPATAHSRIVLDPDTTVTDSSGHRHRLVDLPEKTSIHCPVHLDHNPSAFTLRSRHGTPGVHCTTCRATYFVRSERPYYDFDYELQALRPLARPVATNASISVELARREAAEYSGLTETHDTEGPVVQRSLFAVNDVQTGVCFISEQFLPPVQTDADVILVKSPKGSGKTEWLKQIVLDAKKEGQSVLLIGHRQVLIMCTARRLGLTPYIFMLDNPATGGSTVTYKPVTRHYTVSADSLPLLLEPARHKFDIILIDEVEQVLAHLTSQTLREQRSNALTYLSHYLRQSKKAYLLDADLNRVTGTCFPDLLGPSKKRAFVVVNDWRKPRGPMNLYQNHGHLVQVLRDHVAMGKRCFVCANSKKTVKILAAMLSAEFKADKKIKAITSDNSQTQDVQDFLMRLPESLLAFDCVLVSPAVGTGVDITFPQSEAKIDAVFGFFGPLVNTHFDVDQQLCRVRHPGSVHVWVSPQKFSFCTEQKIIREELMASAKREFTLVGLNPDGTARYSEADIAYSKVFSEVTAQRRASKNEFRENFCELRRLSGWEIVPIENDEDAAESGRELAGVGKELDAMERIQRVCNAAPICKETYQDLLKKSKRGTLRESDEAKMRRYEIEVFYLSPISEELVTRDRNGTYRDAIRTYEFLLEPDSLLHDRWNRDYGAMTVDRAEEPARRRLLIKLYSAAGVFEEGRGFNTEMVVTKDSLSAFVTTCRAEKVSIERLLDMSLRGGLDKNPVQQLTAFLKQAGLSMENFLTKRDGESKVYFYRVNLDQLTQVDADVTRRRDPAAKAEWDRLQEIRFPEDEEWSIEAIRARKQAPKAEPVETIKNELETDFSDLDTVQRALDEKAERYRQVPDEAPSEPDF